MSEQKLNYRQKLFAALEALIKETKVRTVDLNMYPGVAGIPIQMQTRTRELDFSISVAAASVDFSINTGVNSIMEDLTQPKIQDAAISELDASVIDENVQPIRECTVVDTDPQLDTTTVDLFRQYRIDPKLAYTTTVKNLKPKELKTGIHQLQTNIYPRLKDNLSFFLHLPVERKTAVLSLISEKEQLHYWRKAVEKTRKDPKKLKLLGVYTGIPSGKIEHPKIDFSNKRLTYNYKTASAGVFKKEEPLKDIAIFSDLESNKAVRVSK